MSMKITNVINDINLTFSISFQDLTSHELIECLSKFFDENVHQFTVIDYIIFCKACAKADYKPANWETKVCPTLETFKFGIYLGRLHGFNWAEFAFDLDKLGYHDARLIYKILSSKYFQSQSWYTQQNVEKLREILSRYDEAANSLCEESDSESLESDDEMTTAKVERRNESPLLKDLSNIFGSEKVCSNVRIEGMLTIPYVLKMDLQSGEFLPITEAQTLSRDIGVNELL